MAKMKLTNTKKREEFLATFARWPIWAGVPELPLTVRRFDLPGGYAVVVAQYSPTDTRYDGTRWPHWQFLKPGDNFKPFYACSAAVICGDLLNLGHIEVEMPDEKAPGEAATSDQRGEQNPTTSIPPETKSVNG